MKIRCIIFLIFSLWVASCKIKPRLDAETKAFTRYLRIHFNKELPQEKRLYLMFPSNQCINCNRYNSHLASGFMSKRMTVVTGFPRSNFRYFNEVWLDPNDFMLRLPFLNYSNKMVVTEKAEVVAVFPVRDFYHQLDSLQNSWISER